MTTVKSNLYIHTRLPKGFILTMALFVILVSLTLFVSYGKHLERTRINYLQGLKKEHDQLQAEWTKLLLEEGLVGGYARVEEKATLELNMSVPNSEDVILISE